MFGIWRLQLRHLEYFQSPQDLLYIQSVQPFVVVCWLEKAIMLYFVLCRCKKSFLFPQTAIPACKTRLPHFPLRPIPIYIHIHMYLHSYRYHVSLTIYSYIQVTIQQYQAMGFGFGRTKAYSRIYCLLLCRLTS